MNVESGGNINDLVIGNASESASESNEVLAERIAAAAARMAQIQKDEQSVVGHDSDLVQVIKNAPNYLLQIIIFFINNGIPALTILAVISIVHHHAYTVCKKIFAAISNADPQIENINLGNKETSSTIALWLAMIMHADKSSNTTMFSSFAENETFKNKLSQHLCTVLKHMIVHHKQEPLTEDTIKTLLSHYFTVLFSEQKK